MATILEKITERDLLDFGTQINIQDTGSAADTLFPNRKVENFEVEYMRLAESPALPRVAMVHGFDTEAAIGERPTAELVRIEQLLIKEKIPISETLRRLKARGVNDNTALNYIFDDIATMTRAVKTRADVAKYEALCTGKMIIAENGANLAVDFGVSDDSRYTFDWSDKNADILGDLKKIWSAGRRKGQRYNRAVTSQKILDYMLENEYIQKAVNGVNMLGVMITQDGLNSLLNRMFGFTVEVNDDYYKRTLSDGTSQSARFFDENKFVLFVADNNGAVGVGLWGVTPEEQETAAFAASGMAENMLITLSQWHTPDPVQTWTKASALFTPVLPNPNGHVIIHISDGTTVLGELDVETTASTTAGNSVVSIYPATASEGNSYVYIAANKYQSVNAGDDLSEWTAITDGTEITVPSNKANKLTVAEIDSDGKAVAVGKAQINFKRTTVTTDTTET